MIGRMRHENAHKVTCAGCGVLFPRAKSGVAKESYCTPECWMKARSIERTCKQCGSTFKVWRSVVAGPTNGSGNFCSRPCYEVWLLAGAAEKPHYIQMKGARRHAVVLGQVCRRCGTSADLDIHHVIPRRIGGLDHTDNLIPLCKSCHKIVECFTCDLIIKGTQPHVLKEEVLQSLAVAQAEAHISAAGCPD